MDYISFMKELQLLDSRITFDIVKSDAVIENNRMPAFYHAVNPVNVEFEFNEGIVRLVPLDELEMAKKQYQYIDDGFVFATCNGSPIYEKDGKVYTCVCGKSKILEEEMAVSITALFEEVISRL